MIANFLLPDDHHFGYKQKIPYKNNAPTFK
jgi:hypothetical protein